MSRLVDVPVTLVHQTEKAILIRLDDDETKVWLAKSQVEFSENDPRPGVTTVTLPENLALEKGMI